METRRRLRRAVPVLLALGLAAWVALGPLHARPSALAASGSAAATSPLLELAERLLSFPVGPGLQPMTVDLLPGEIPQGLPVSFPVPQGGRLVGSAVRYQNGQLMGATLVFDLPVNGANGGPQDAVAVFRQALERQGWRPAPFGGPGRGFQAAPLATGLFCPPNGGAWSVSVTAFPASADMADVRVYVQKGPGGAGPCAQPAGPGVPPPGSDKIPPLYVPAGVVLENVSGGGGSNQWRSEATAQTTKSAGELEAYFARQLQAAGWVRQAGRDDGALAWSLWSVPGEGNWQGFLYVLQGPGEGVRTLSVEVSAHPLAASGASAGSTTMLH